jgi:hypothetical protein
MSDVPNSDEAPAIANSAVDETQRKRRESRKARAAREDREFFRLVVASEAGRRFLWAILQETHAFETMFPAGPAGFPDPHAAWFQAGKQDTGQRLYQTWHYRAPAETMQMLIENDKRFQQVEAA